jgi:hypothetical protein
MAVDLEYYGVPPADYRELENRTPLTATAGQTTFSALYSPGYVDVYFNGAKLDPRTEFTGTDGLNIVLTTAAALGDVVEVISRAQVQIANVYTQQQVNAMLVPYFTVTTGTGDAQVGTTNPTFSSYVDGMVIKVRAVGPNTLTTPAITLNGLTTKTIVSNVGDAALSGYDWIANSDITLRYNQSIDRLVYDDFGFQQFSGGRKQTFISNGSFTVPAGVKTIYISGCAGGGGGGAGIITAVNNCSTGGSGGGAGQWVLRTVANNVTPGQVIPITIGAGGAGGPATSGFNQQAGTGGQTLIGTAGSILTLSPGAGGYSGTGGVYGTYGGAAGGAGYPAGQYAQDVTASTSTVGSGGFGGAGASGPFGTSGSAGRGAYAGNIVGVAGYGYGAGGSGGGGVYGNPSATSLGAQGTVGLQGIVMLEW